MNEPIIERRAILLRAELSANLDTQTITGVAVRYGDTANIGGYFEERIEPDAFRDMDDVVLNIQHDRARPIARTGGGGLELTNSTDKLRVSATPVATRDGKDAVLMVEHRVLRGFSVEFVAKREDYVDDVRVIREARLVGLGLVDRPAYGDSLAKVARRMAELRTGRQRRRWL